jgi:hypothetical protein
MFSETPSSRNGGRRKTGRALRAELSPLAIGSDRDLLGKLLVFPMFLRRYFGFFGWFLGENLQCEFAVIH